MAARILVVEDDDDLRYLYTTSLRLAGFQAESVRDGFDALVRLEQHPPDLLVVDLGLPTVSGDSVMRELSANPATARIPVVVVTGQRLLAVPPGAAAVLTKPVGTGELIDLVVRCLRPRRGPAPAAARSRGRRGPPARG